MNWVFAALFVLMGAVLLLPFAVKRVEEELELFLLAMGALSVTVSGLWSAHLLAEALREPVKIALAVLVSGLAFRAARSRIKTAVVSLVDRLGLGPFLFALVLGLGLASSAITAIVAALVLVEVVSTLRLPREEETRITVLACYSIGLGAALTPLGEPLSTIAVAKLAGPPHHAGFFFLAKLLGRWIVVGIVVFALLAAAQGATPVTSAFSLGQDAPEKRAGILRRAGKVYVFVAALVLLSTGLSPLVDRFVLGMRPEFVYWLNSASAVLDNATLAAAEISPRMGAKDLEFLLMGLLLAGGMLIPGNIPNIVAAGKLGIKSGDWARFALPLGLASMAVFYFCLAGLG